MKKFISLLLLLCAVLLAAASSFAQVNTGELRVTVSDRAGVLPNATVKVFSEGADYAATFLTGPSGEIDCKTLPFGRYILRITKQGFATVSISVDLHSALPLERSVRLGVAPTSATVEVQAGDTLIDPSASGSVMRIGSQQIEDRLNSLPGRSLQDLVDSQPGWLYEGNAVLHPRGSEYQTQFVLDGVPITDNRSPSFGPEIQADDLSALSIYTAGFPAEYGRKMGGVVELNTRRDTNAGLHGGIVLSGGSYATASSLGDLQYLSGRNTYSASASGSMTDHYLNPVVPQNYTNTGTTADFSGRYERDLSSSDRLTLSVRHELSRFLIPNELVQEQAGQRQHGANFETIGIASYQHALSPDSLFTFSAMGRNNSNSLTSNANSTPIRVFQQNYFNESYFKGTFSLHHGHQELKVGVESDNIFLHENFAYNITDPTQFDSTTPANYSFRANRPDLEPSAFLEDVIHFDRWTVSAGLRYDHYQLLLNEYAFSPRLSVGRYFPSASVMLHVSYDRIFQTPSFENILLSSSPMIDSLNSQFLRLPVRPSHGNYEEGGMSKALFSRARLDINVYRRDVGNFADDDQLLNTGISYPIAFDHAVIYGAEGKFELVQWGKLSGFVSYSYMVGNAWLPVTGGLFLGEDANAAATQLSGHFPDSQDQRNTLRTRFRYQVLPRLWFAAGASYGSGLPFQYTGTQSDALAQYGPQVVSRLNFDRGRTLPVLTVDVSAGVQLFSDGSRKLTLQADGENLNDRLNVLDFGGLFSMNAIAPGRSFALRARWNF